MLKGECEGRVKWDLPMLWVCVTGRGVQQEPPRAATLIRGVPDATPPGALPPTPVVATAAPAPPYPSTSAAALAAAPMPTRTSADSAAQSGPPSTGPYRPNGPEGPSAPTFTALQKLVHLTEHANSTHPSCSLISYSQPAFLFAHVHANQPVFSSSFTFSSDCTSILTIEASNYANHSEDDRLTCHMCLLLQCYFVCLRDFGVTALNTVNIHVKLLTQHPLA